jgi:hypothetical protein
MAPFISHKSFKHHNSVIIYMYGFKVRTSMAETKTTRTLRRGRGIQCTPEQIAQWEAERKEFEDRCLPIFNQVKLELIETHYNWYVTVEPDSGDYFVDKDIEVASQKCREKHPDKIHQAFRINETGVCGTI